MGDVAVCRHTGHLCPLQITTGNYTVKYGTLLQFEQVPAQLSTCN